MRVVVISILVLLGIFIAADRILWALTEDLLAEVVQEEGELPAEPDISIEGFPFLTQAIEGRYDSVRVGLDVAALGLPPGASADIRLQGAAVPLSSALSRSVSTVPVERVLGTVTFPFDYLSEQLGAQVGSPAMVIREGDGLRVETTVSVGGQDFPVAATAALALADNVVALTASDVSGFGTALPDEVTAQVIETLQLAIPLPVLPYGLVLTELQVIDDGLQVVAEGSNIVLEVPA